MTTLVRSVHVNHRARSLAILGVLTLLLSMVAAATPAAAADFVAHRSVVYGHRANVLGGTITSGPSALTGLGYCAAVPAALTNSAATVNVGTFGTVGAIATDTDSYSDADAEGINSHVEITDVNLLSDAIQIDAVTATANSERQDGGTYAAEATTTVAGLTVLGDSITVTGERQVIQVAGLATIILNGQYTREDANQAAATGLAVQIRLLDGSNTQILVGKAYTETVLFDVDSVTEGWGQGSLVRVGGAIESGPTVNLGNPCTGTDDNTLSRSAASIDTDLVDLTAVESTVTSNSAAPAYVTTTNTIDEVSILDGLLVLENIATESHAESDGAGGVTKTSDVDLGSITANVGPVPVSIDVPDPGGSVEIIGVGTLTFHDVKETSERIQTTAVIVELLPSLGGGAVVEISRTHAAVLTP